MKTVLPIVFAFLLILTACATPPTEEMDRAHDAVTRAENDADAVTYAGSLVQSARTAVTNMQNEADAKRYDAAKNFAAEAFSLAERAIAEGRTGAARARDEAAGFVDSLAAPLNETAYSINAAMEAGDIQADFDSLSADFELARQTYDEARQNLDQNNYPSAVSKAENVRNLLSGINSALIDAAQAVSRKQ